MVTLAKNVRAVDDDATARRVAEIALAETGVTADASAVAMLAETVRGLCRDLSRALEGVDPDTDAGAVFDDTERLDAKASPGRFLVSAPDAILLRALSSVDLDAAREARAARAEQRTTPTRDRLWHAHASVNAPFGVVKAAHVLWSARVHRAWERAKQRPPALVRELLHDRLIPLTHATASAVGEPTLLDRKGAEFGRLDVAAVDPEIVRRGVDLFGSTMWHRLTRFFALTSHEAWAFDRIRPEVATIDGGFAELARKLGCSERDSTPELRALLSAGQSLRLELPGRTVGGLWTWEQRRAAPGRRASLEVQLARVWVPGCATDLRVTQGRDTAARERRRLVPVPRHDPPHRMLRRNEWGPTWTLGTLVVVLLVDRADELARSGSVGIDDRAWRNLFDEAGLAAEHLEVVRSGLVTGDGVAPPLLTRVRQDRYTLADAHASERAFIVDGGDSRATGRNPERNRLNARRGRNHGGRR